MKLLRFFSAAGLLLAFSALAQNFPAESGDAGSGEIPIFNGTGSNTTLVYPTIIGGVSIAQQSLTFNTNIAWVFGANFTTSDSALSLLGSNFLFAGFTTLSNQASPAEPYYTNEFNTNWVLFYDYQQVLGEGYTLSDWPDVVNANYVSTAGTVGSATNFFTPSQPGTPSYVTLTHAPTVGFFPTNTFGTLGATITGPMSVAGSISLIQDSPILVLLDTNANFGNATTPSNWVGVFFISGGARSPLVRLLTEVNGGETNGDVGGYAYAASGTLGFDCFGEFGSSGSVAGNEQRISLRRYRATDTTGVHGGWIDDFVSPTTAIFINCLHYDTNSGAYFTNNNSQNVLTATAKPNQNVQVEISSKGLQVDGVICFPGSGPTPGTPGTVATWFTVTNTVNGQAYRIPGYQ